MGECFLLLTLTNVVVKRYLCANRHKIYRFIFWKILTNSGKYDRIELSKSFMERGAFDCLQVFVNEAAFYLFYKQLQIEEGR